MVFPEILVSDNITQFSSNELSEFYSQSSIKHGGIASFHPQLNGQAERFVDTIKRALPKAKKHLNDFPTPHPVLEEKSPAEVLTCRKIRTIHAAMLPNRNSTRISKTKQKRRYKAGDLVYTCDYRPNHRLTAAVVRKHHGSMMYEVEVGQ